MCFFCPLEFWNYLPAFYKTWSSNTRTVWEPPLYLFLSALSSLVGLRHPLFQLLHLEWRQKRLQHRPHNPQQSPLIYREKTPTAQNSRFWQDTSPNLPLKALLDHRSHNRFLQTRLILHNHWRCLKAIYEINAAGRFNRTSVSSNQDNLVA